MASQKPFFVIVPGASQNPSQYGYLSYLLQRKGYPTYSALLPSVGATGNITAEDDMNYVRNNMIIPVLEHEEHDVILLTHSYSGMPGSAAAKGFGKAERTAKGKKTSVIGQIFLASILPKGGDGKDVVGAFGGAYPPHIRPDPEANLLRCDDRVGPLFQDVEPVALADVFGVTSMAQGMTSFTSPCPRATWDSDQYKGRIAYIKTLEDKAIPAFVQQGMLEATGADWIVKEISSGHSAQISKPELLTNMLVELAEGFEKF